MQLRSALAILAALCLTGCASPSGIRFYNPATWFSGSEGRSVARTEAKVETASTALVKEAQKTAHETQLALVAAPASRPVDVARESNDATVAALDQIAGPLTVAEAASLRAQVAGLLSEIATERTIAEKERQARREIIADASTTIDELRAQLAEKQKALADGFARENAVANEARNTKFLIYGAIGLWFFVAFVLPILSRAFPAVAAIATAGQSIVAPFAVAAGSTAKRLAGDLVGGIHDLRAKLKTAPLTKAEADAVLREWITEADGTAAQVDAIRREKSLV